MVEDSNNNLIAAYETDASMIRGKAERVLFPTTIADIKKIVQEEKNIVARGGGTGLVGGSVPQNSIVIDISKMNKILEFDRDKKEVYVEAGIILDELNNKLERDNLEFPVKPSSHAVCTIGGMIATNAVGNRAIKYGKTSEWIKFIEVIDGSGELLKIGKTELEDFSGLEGISGIIVRARLKLDYRRDRTACLFSSSDIDEIIEKVRELKLDKNISAIELLDKMTSKLIGFEEKYNIIVEYESDKGSYKEKEYEDLMNKRDNAYPTLAKEGYVHIEDPKILLHKFKEFTEFLEKEQVPYFGHIGVGVIHPCFRKGEEEKIKKMMILVKRLQGQVSGEHGIGLTKKQFLEINDTNLIRIIKKRRDPNNKLNPGKVIDF